MRDSVEITKASAAYIAKWRMKEMIDSDKSMDMLKRFAMSKAIEKGGGVDEIADMLYSMGIRLSIDRNDPDHRAWIENKAVILEKA